MSVLPDLLPLSRPSSTPMHGLERPTVDDTTVTDFPAIACTSTPTVRWSTVGALTWWLFSVSQALASNRSSPSNTAPNP